MSHLQLQLHSQAPPPSLFSSSRSSLKLFTNKNNSFSPTNSLPFKPFTIRCRHSDVFETRTNVSSPNPNSSVGALPPRSGAYKITKDGYLLLQFAPSLGPRQYDWNSKQIFSLSVAEMGSVISLGGRESCEFFHDPFMGKSDEGKVRKVFKVEPLPDGSGYFFNLNVQNKIINVDETINLPISKAELAVLRSIFKYIMPYLLGWHTFANSINPEYSAVANNANPTYGGDYEWNR
ncbi:hypothetical protein TSUD_369650 [Trifolium subterraneum]|uniref:WHY domain class transcription factor n=1 Tax=Trifolium subterraneum TaxID=3900 RepID=A0A2Z6N3X8_TRISU|nr:hypothetical protein TSUD_369650 [Trifolium subterraneum]